MDTSLIHVQSPYIEMMKNNFFFFRSSTNDANKTPSPPLKSKEVSSWRSVSLLSVSFYDSGSGKKNFTDLSKSPHGHSKKVHPKKSGRDSSRDLSVPVLIRTIRRLTKEKVRMASEVSRMLRNQVAERASAKEKVSILQAELDSRTQRLEIEKNELQSLLEKELNRISSDWSLKLEKYQIEQHRLRERARELVEKNVSLQREVSSFNEKEEKVQELKSETLLTTVPREKLYSEEMDIKQLQADLAAAVRGNDIFKCKVQIALDALSYATAKLKYLELQFHHNMPTTFGNAREYIHKQRNKMDSTKISSIASRMTQVENRLGRAREAGERPSMVHWGGRGYLGGQMGKTAKTGHFQPHSVGVNPWFLDGPGAWCRNAQTRQLSHPLPVLRACEIDEWSRSQEYRSLLQRAIQIRAEELLLKLGRAFTLAESVCITSTSKAGWRLKKACGYKPEKSDSCVCFDLEWFRSNAIYKQKTPMAEEAHLACGLHM
ncbi:hypothetical protein T459_03969 [Capsicum annuum]|uniref:Uncharacterized protein n=1 Tax=Capsicum annuum TaxID=4072 RepID=A0A2G3APC7_CAPAN|nr:hypothetical protein T459_03969 [Capsicum annuum]